MTPTIPSARYAGTDTLPQDSLPLDRWAARAAPALHLSGVLWLCVAVLGQLLLALYVLGFYGRAALKGQPETWNEVLAQGYMPGHAFLNAVLAAHLAFVSVIVVGGALQLLPVLRRTAPAFHRWTGRLYLLAAAVLSIGGLILIWVGGKVAGDLPQHLGVSLNALLILAFAGIAWWQARARRLDAHRRWALRLFLAVSGVWFFRVGLMLWLAVNQGPAGFDPKTFTGPTLSILSFTQYLLPLALLELYLRAQRRAGPAGQWAMAASMFALSLATLAGIGLASAMMWLPRMH